MEPAGRTGYGDGCRYDDASNQMRVKGYDTWPDMGLDVAHLILTCPAMQNRKAPIRELHGMVDVDGTDVCGWCRRVWKARHDDATNQR